MDIRCCLRHFAICQIVVFYGVVSNSRHHDNLVVPLMSEEARMTERPGDSVDHTLDEFTDMLIHMISFEITRSSDAAYIAGLMRALSIVKEVWQQ